MKGATFLVLILLSGCGGFTTLEQLEAQALLSGDWSAVEQRERIIARREARNYNPCAAGTVAVCQSGVSDERCSCVKSEALHSLIFSR